MMSRYTPGWSLVFTFSLLCIYFPGDTLVRWYSWCVGLFLFVSSVRTQYVVHVYAFVSSRFRRGHAVVFDRGWLALYCWLVA